jgi:hypothetical protein
MGKRSNRNYYFARDRLKEQRRSRQNIPPTQTISVIRPVKWPNELSQKKYLHTMNVVLGKTFSDQQRTKFHIIRPEYLGLIQVRSKLLTEHMRETKQHHDRQKTVEGIAWLLQTKFTDMLKDLPSCLSFSLDDLSSERLGGRFDSKVINPDTFFAGQINGWRGPNKHYPQEDCLNGVPGLNQLASENNIIRDTIVEETGSSPFIHDVIPDPFIALIKKDKPILSRERSAIKRNLYKYGAFPLDITVGDPVIILSTGEFATKHQTLAVRELGYSALQAVA